MPLNLFIIETLDFSWRKGCQHRLAASILLFKSIQMPSRSPTSAKYQRNVIFCIGFSIISQIWKLEIANFPGALRAPCQPSPIHADVMPRHYIYCQNLFRATEISGALPAAAAIIVKFPVPPAVSIWGAKGTP